MPVVIIRRLGELAGKPGTSRFLPKPVIGATFTIGRQLLTFPLRASPNVVVMSTNNMEDKVPRSPQEQRN